MKQTVTTRMLFISILLLLSLTAAACGTKENVNNSTASAGGEQQNQSDSATNTNTGETVGTEGSTNADSNGANQPSNTDGGQSNSDGEEAAAEKQITIKAYFTDAELLELQEQERQIAYPSGDAVAMLKAAYASLQLDGTNQEVSLWKTIELLDLKISEGTVTLDVHIPDEARLGAPGEMMAIEALTKTMFQFDAVSNIELLVDGKQVESLMGHETLEHPIVKP
ncbi:hypothetical protein FHS18_002506 [Paenibacillus phyllosphaerae]|uniref:GerMN domain-containing protein n=1 Tax=Paenibacillus phyllosphaerae TaxID=274593 RepID=A0A7W5AXS7_9BACL|nr:GerMN domain-containing protein [Paenibacillus phyllosphaerae]MBB3110439.1 hypothetical protein [Paenibacillus phyllosphaerae]